MDFLEQIPILIEKVGLGGTVLILVLVLPYGFVFLLLKQLTQKQEFIETQQTDFSNLNTRVLQGILMQAQDSTKALKELSLHLAMYNAQLNTQQNHVNLLATKLTELDGKLAMVIQFAIDDVKGE